MSRCNTPETVKHVDHTVIVATEDDCVWFEKLVKTVRAKARGWELPVVQALRRGAVEAADSPMSRPVPSHIEVTAHDADGVATWLFRPKNHTHTPPILYFHGGGYVCGSVQAARGVAAALALEFNAQVLAVGYRQAPEHKYPAALNDAWTSFCWLTRHCDKPVILIGDSAGGNLAIVTATRAGREMPGKVRTAIASSAWFDLSMSTPSWVQHVDCDLAPRELGVFFRNCYLGPDHSGDLPRPPSEADFVTCAPLLIQVGGSELGFDDSALLATAAMRAGIPVGYEIYRAMPHNFIKFARPISDFAIARMVAWARDW